VIPVSERQTGNISTANPLRFPLYLMRGEVIEIDGRFYSIPEAVACDNPKQLFTFLYERRVRPLGSG